MKNRERIAELRKVLEEYCTFPHAAALKLVELGYTRQAEPCEPNPTSLDELKVPPAEPTEDRVEAAKLILERNSFDIAGYNVIPSRDHERIAHEILKLCPEYEPVELETLIFNKGQILGLIPAQAFIDYDLAKEVLGQVSQATIAPYQKGQLFKLKEVD